MTKIGRNAPCPCGSGNKYKKCCGGPLVQPSGHFALSGLSHVIHRHTSDEVIRVAQQGKGRPIISTKLNDYTFVATGKSIHWSKNWKTFTDFLCDYLKKMLGSDWGNAELAKPLDERHPVLKWYNAFCEYQDQHKEKSGDLYSAPMTSVTICYLGLAYNLYLLDHNAELQKRLVERLKDLKQFQGAYYELIVANCLIRAGFTLELENEADREKKHCEFAAISQVTGRRYWVEAKMRSTPNILGKTLVDGSKSKDPTSRMSAHLREALLKPAPDDRIIFLDVNAELNVEGSQPTWLNKAVRRLEDRERNLETDQKAYVFVTNMAFHRMLDSTNPGKEILAFGLGLSDFGKVGKIRLPDWYRQKKKHIDAHSIVDALRNYPQIPETLDGRPASEAFHHSQRIRIGETYFFEDAGEKGVVGTVTSVAAIEAEKRAYISVKLPNGGSNMILTTNLSNAEVEDFKKYGDAYFGANKVQHNKCNDIFEFYEWLVNCYSQTPRERLLELAHGHPEFEHLMTLETEDLVLRLCEGWAASINAKK